MGHNISPLLLVTLEILLQAGLVVFILLRRQGRATTNLAWIAVIIAIPVVGAIAYLLVGNVRLGGSRIRRYSDVQREVQRARMASQVPSPPVLEPAYLPIATLAESVGENIPLGGNELDLISETDLFIHSLIADIDGAERHCHLMYYIFQNDDCGRDIADSLIRAAKRGVACRLLVDAAGSWSFIRSRLCEELREAGVQVVEALHANAVRLLFARLDLRNHRKIAVIDGEIGFMGSQNIVAGEFALRRRHAPWVDASVRARGPISRDLQALFVQDWYLDTGESLTSTLEEPIQSHPHGVIAQIMGTGPNTFNEALRHLVLTSFHSAREELLLTTPYFVPDEATFFALQTAARRGVDTTLITTARSDSRIVAAASRSYYEALLDAGVRIFEYQRGLLHAKTMTFDRRLAIITSANLDRRSFDLNFEVSMVVYDDDFASRLRFLQRSYETRAREIDALHWRRRAWPRKLAQNAAGTLSPLL